MEGEGERYVEFVVVEMEDVNVRLVEIKEVVKWEIRKCVSLIVGYKWVGECVGLEIGAQIGEFE